MFIKKSSFHVLYTENIQATHDFFQSINAEIKEQDENKVVVVAGDFELHYIQASSEPFVAYKYIAKSKNYGEGIIFYVEVEDLEYLQSLIEPSGGSLITQIQLNHWNCREFLFEDPNGFKFVAYK